MSLSLDQKKKIIKDFEIHEGDTGSPEIQVALLTERITRLAGHLKEHKKDDHSRRGLTAMINERRRLLHYLRRKDAKRYQKVIAKIGLEK